MSNEGRFRVYETGLCCMSVCASKNMSEEEIERRANLEEPTGIESKWTIAKDKTFNGGTPMPCQCEVLEHCQHWLLMC